MGDLQNIIPKNRLTTPDHSVDASAGAVVFVERFARALHRYGLPAHRVEAALTRASDRLGIHGQFFATPTAVFASLTRGDDTRTLLVRLDPGEINLVKLAALHLVLQRLSQGEIDAAAGVRELDSIEHQRSRYGGALIAAGFALSSAAVSIVFGGGWREFVVCALIGLMSGSLAVLSQRLNLRPFEPLAALLAGLTAGVAAAALQPLSLFVAMCAGLIVLIPGLTLTIALSELANRNLASGSARMTGAFLLFLEIGFGVAMGLALSKVIVGPAHMVAPDPLPAWTLVPAIVFMSASLTVLFQAPLRSIGWIAAICTLSYAGARFGSEWLGMEVGAFMGAVLVGLASNAFARWRGQVASMLLIPGIMLLVPGSIGFSSLSSLIQSDVLTGLEMAFRMGLTGVALVVGLLLANRLLPSRHPI